MQLHIIGDAHRHNAKEDDDQQVAKPYIRKVGGVEKAEDDAQQPDENHLESAEPHQRQSHKTRHSGGRDDGPLHRLQLHPALRTGPARPEPRRGIVGTRRVVEVVVDKVGVNLHDKCEEQTQQGGNPAERAPALTTVDIGQRHANHHRNSRSAKRLRARCQ